MRTQTHYRAWSFRAALLGVAAAFVVSGSLVAPLHLLGDAHNGAAAALLHGGPEDLSFPVPHAPFEDADRCLVCDGLGSASVDPTPTLLEIPPPASVPEVTAHGAVVRSPAPLDARPRAPPTS